MNSLSDKRSCKEAFYGKELILADRDMVETESDEILRNADTEDVSLLVVGDPFGYPICTTALIIANGRQGHDTY